MLAHIGLHPVTHEILTTHMIDSKQSVSAQSMSYRQVSAKPNVTSIRFGTIFVLAKVSRLWQPY